MSGEQIPEQPLDGADPGPDPDLVEYLVLRTPALSSSHAIAPVLTEFVETSQISILDLVGVQTDAIGEYSVIDAESLPGLAEIPRRDGDVGGVLSDDDIALVCAALGPNASALILVAEDRWARALADAVRVAGGRVAGGERIPRRSIEQSQRGPTRGARSETSPWGDIERSRRQRLDLLRRRPLLGDGVVAVEPPR